jgi:hypothetical protein
MWIDRLSTGKANLKTRKTRKLTPLPYPSATTAAFSMAGVITGRYWVAEQGKARRAGGAVALPAFYSQTHTHNTSVNLYAPSAAALIHLR